MAIQQKDSIIIMLSILSLILLSLVIYFAIRDVKCMPTHAKKMPPKAKEEDEPTKKESKPETDLLENPFFRPLYTE